MRKAGKWLADAAGQWGLGAALGALLWSAAVTAVARAALSSFSANLGLWWPALLLGVMVVTYVAILAAWPRFGGKKAAVVQITKCYAQGVHLRSQVLQSHQGTPESSRFPHEEHEWRMRAIDVVHRRVSPAKGFWVGSAVTGMLYVTDARALAKEKNPTLSDDNIAVLARIDRILERLASVLNDLQR